MINFSENQTRNPIIFSYLRLSKRRKVEIESSETQKQFLEEMDGFNRMDDLMNCLRREEK